MLTRKDIQNTVADAVKSLNLKNLDSKDLTALIEIDYPKSAFGDFTTNVALTLKKAAGLEENPRELAQQIANNIDKSQFEKIEVAGPGFINLTLKPEVLVSSLNETEEPQIEKKEKILVEYFQPNIAKPLHIGHLRTAIIGDSIVRSLKYVGHDVESDTHMGDWGTQFGILIAAYKDHENKAEIAADPITKLNELYVQANSVAPMDSGIKTSDYYAKRGKEEFVKLEQGDPENRRIWKQFVDWSMEKFLKINDLMDITAFDHHWPESFYEDKMPAVLEKLRVKNLLVESQGAQIVNLEPQGLGIAVVVKSDGGTTYLLRDLATFIYRRTLGYERQLYVVDNRQSHAFKQLFAILELLGEIKPGEGQHIDYGFMSFKGSALSTRKGNMVLAEDVIREAEDKVAKIIEQKNPDLPNKQEVIKAVSKGALKYYDLSHNRHSDIEFDWNEALDFEGNSGPYLQYTYARLSSILRRVGDVNVVPSAEMTATEHQLAVESSKLPDIVNDSLKDYLPNTLSNYLYSLANLANKFYHESPVASEADAGKKSLRVALVKKVRAVLKQGLDLLGIKTLEEM